MLALHSLRSISESPRHDLELDQVRNAVLSVHERSAMAELARATGSAAPLAELLEQWKIEIDIPPAEFESREYRRWLWKVSGARGSSTHATAAEWLGMLSHTPWPGKVRVLLRAVWPTRNDILINNPETPNRLLPTLAARGARTLRGLSALPTVARWRVTGR